MNAGYEQVGLGLERVLGRQLTRVDYLCFDYERDNALSAYAFGGEVVLRFEADQFLYFSWAEAGGCVEHFSLVASDSPTFGEGALVAVDASSHVLWSAHIGSSLQAAEVLGWGGVPAVARLVFSGGSVLVGCGTESGFRGGDYVLVRPDEPMWLHCFGQQASTLWWTAQ